MSHGYGFLTESSILAKKSKQLKINDNSGQVLMESILKKQMERIKTGQKGDQKQKDKTAPRSNPGIEQRMKKDENQREEIKLAQKNIYRILESKSKLYQKCQSNGRNIGDLLTDFESKNQKLSKQQAQEYEKAREAFYRGEIRRIENQQRQIHENVQTEKSSITLVRERLHWQKQAMEELRGQIYEQSKPKVIQSFDNKFSQEQKEAFNTVLNEEQEEKLKIEAIKRKRQQMIQERLRKLRKFNITVDVGEAASLHKQQEKDNAPADNQQ